MPVAGGGFEQCYNVQAAVAADSMLVVAGDVVQAPNDKQQVEPMVKKINELPEELGKAETLLGDNGYFSELSDACLVRPAGSPDPLAAHAHQDFLQGVLVAISKHRSNVNACEAAGIEPLIATGREVHHPSLTERFAEAPAAPENPTPVETMTHRLQTPEGKKLYATRKCIPEPVFGTIKSVLGFRQFLLRGLDNVRGEWSLVTMAWNLKRMFVLKAV